MTGRLNWVCHYAGTYIYGRWGCSSISSYRVGPRGPLLFSEFGWL